MVKRWLNTNAAQMCSMIGVDDEMVLSVSHGEVTKSLSDDDSGDNDLTGTICDHDIFGKLITPEERKTKEESLRMGHISIGVPVVNIQYFMGKNPVLAKNLNIPVKDLCDVVYSSCGIITDPGDTDLAYKQILTEKEYFDARDKYGNSFTIMYGAKAIEFLLEKDQILDRNYMVLHYLPVIPSCMRYIYFSDGESGSENYVFSPLPVNDLYEKVIRMSRRMQNLLNIGAPEIIIRNSSYLLQKAVDNLISNGVHGTPTFGLFDYMPYDSLNEIHEIITRIDKRERSVDYGSGIDMNSLIDSTRTYFEYDNAHFVDGVEYEMDDPVVVESERLQSLVNESVRPFVNQYINLNHSRYCDFKDRIFENVINEFYKCAYRWYESGCISHDPCDVDLKYLCDLKSVFEAGIARRIDLYIKKQLKWSL